MHPVILLLLSSITTDWIWLLIFTRFLDHTQRRTTVGRSPLNEWSVRRRDLYLTTHNNNNRQTSMPSDVLRIFIYLPLKIRRLRPGLNPRTWVPKASTLPLDHRSSLITNEIAFLTQVEGRKYGTFQLQLAHVVWPPSSDSPVVWKQTEGSSHSHNQLLETKSFLIC